MSAFARFLHPPPAARRAYSSFFSSKPGGGGRYFNSAKPPKVDVRNGAAKANPAKVESNAESHADGAQSPAKGSTGANAIVNANADHSSSPSPPSSSTSTPPDPSNGKPSDGSTASDFLSGPAGAASFLHRPQHPVVKAKDFKLHQFFSLHRPLLLLAHPASILEPAPNVSFESATEARMAEADATSSPWLLDEFPEATADADAAAARQLTRALTMSHAGAAMAWENTLRRLGLDLDKDAERVGLRQQMDKEWQEVMMDSVKRKRRKKMKKHKLKKRRKATRATRLKIGR